MNVQSQVMIEQKKWAVTEHLLSTAQVLFSYIESHEAAVIAI